MGRVNDPEIHRLSLGSNIWNNYKENVSPAMHFYYHYEAQEDGKIKVWLTALGGQST